MKKWEEKTAKNFEPVETPSRQLSTDLSQQDYKSIGMQVFLLEPP